MRISSTEKKTQQTTNKTKLFISKICAYFLYWKTSSRLQRNDWWVISVQVLRSLFQLGRLICKIGLSFASRQ